MRDKYTVKIRRSVISPIGPSISYLPLTQDKFALIDSSDAEWVGKYNWSAWADKTTDTFYAIRHQPLPTGKRHSVFLHRELLDFPEGQVTDHINRNGLDNRRCNLRVATTSQNAFNRKVSTQSTTGVKGVGWYPSANLWRTSTTVNGKRRHTFHRKFADAVAARQLIAEELHKEFVRHK